MLGLVHKSLLRGFCVSLYCTSINLENPQLNSFKIDADFRVFHWGIISGIDKRVLRLLGEETQIWWGASDGGTDYWWGKFGHFLIDGRRETPSPYHEKTCI